ncbi:MAG: hypothetical protein P8X57_08700 [Cyclobacteriaceae bacterium]
MNNSLLIGIGNYARSDDALGWCFADHFSYLVDKIDIEYRYQLQIEDADLVSQYDTVYFADATCETYGHGFLFTPCQPAFNCSFTSHSLTPETILQMARELYACKCEGFVIGISGQRWELKEGISQKGYSNLKNATDFFSKYMERQNIETDEKEF